VSISEHWIPAFAGMTTLFAASCGDFNPQRLKNERGVTLIELVLVIVLLGIMGVSMTSAFIPTMTLSVNVDNRKEAFQQGRQAMQRMIREVRSARSFAACAPCNPTNTLNLTDAENNNIIYAWSGTPQDPLTRNGMEISGEVASYTITYLTRTGATPPDQGQIWRVRADLEVRVGDQMIQIKSEAHPRGIF
jgi:prepilin-type N-terminal cleavage/methylation domain-containing protein